MKRERRKEKKKNKEKQEAERTQKESTLSENEPRTSFKKKMVKEKNVSINKESIVSSPTRRLSKPGKPSGDTSEGVHVLGVNPHPFRFRYPGSDHIGRYQPTMAGDLVVRHFRKSQVDGHLPLRVLFVEIMSSRVWR